MTKTVKYWPIVSLVEYLNLRTVDTLNSPVSRLSVGQPNIRQITNHHTIVEVLSFVNEGANAFPEDEDQDKVRQDPAN